MRRFLFLIAALVAAAGCSSAPRGAAPPVDIEPIVQAQVRGTVEALSTTVAANASRRADATVQAFTNSYAPTVVAQQLPTALARAALTSTASARTAATATPVPSPTPAANFALGSNAWISKTVGKVYLSADAAAFNEWAKVAKANDSVGLLDMLLKNKLVSADAGAKVLVLDWNGTHDFIRVRLLEGPKAPQAGWLPIEWLDSAPS